MKILLIMLLGLLLGGLVLFFRFRGSLWRRTTSTTASMPAAVAPAATKMSWSWLVFPLTGLLIFAIFSGWGRPGEVRSIRIVMNNPNGVQIEGLKPGKYWFWAEETPRFQMLDGRMVSVWPDGRTSDEVGGTNRPGYYENMARQSENPIPGVTTFALIVWGKNGPQAFRREGGVIEVEVAGPVIFDQNVPQREAQFYTRNGGENTIFILVKFAEDTGVEPVRGFLPNRFSKPAH